MKAKIKYIYPVFVLFLLLSATVRANAEEKQYFVRFKDEIALFSMEEKEEYILTEDELSECLDAGIVEWYEEDFVVELFDDTESSDAESEEVPIKWDLELINASMAKKIGCTGQTVRVGVIDSGIVKHPDLSDSILEGYNFLDNTEDVTDNKGHGTFVSGMITANQNEQGIVGIAPKTKIVPLKCFDDGYETYVSTIKSAIEAAVDIYDCDIINMSFGISSYSTKLEQAVKYAVDNGVIVIASVGNGGGSTLYYPAAYEEVIGVGSVDRDKNRSYFSQYNSSVFVTAPGEEVWSTNNEGGYSVKSGTSFSAPLVSGMVAVMKGIDEDITTDEVKEYLKLTSIVPGKETETVKEHDVQYGYGVIDVKGCIEKMMEGIDLFISPIEKTNGETSVLIYNNTQNEFDGICLWGEYKKGYLKDLDWKDVIIPPGEGITTESRLTDNTVRCFVWESIADITAISNVREMGVKR